jgi:hypothetical protein
LATISAMPGAVALTGVGAHKVEALPRNKLRWVLKKYNRLAN